MIDNIREFIEMGFNNLIYRSYYELSKRLGILYYRFRNRNIQSHNIISRKNSEHISLICNELNMITNLLEDKFAGEFSNFLSRTDKICEGYISIFNLKDFYWGSPINWNLDPLSGLIWPINTHWSKININDSRYGDIKYNWELNRHQYFVTLGRAYALSGDEKYAITFTEHIGNWIDQNPHEMSSNWYSNLEIALRIISWVFGWNFFKDSKYFTDELKEKFLITLYLMAEHIDRNLNLSKYCINNDHIIGDCVGLLTFSLSFPQFKNAEKWRDKAIKELWNQLERQVFKDGSYFAYSVNYHRFVTQFYLLSIKLLRDNRIEIPQAVLLKVEKMADFLNALILPDGSVPSLGEIDGGVAYKFDSLPFNDYRAVITTGYKLLGLDKQVNFDFDFNEEGFWLLGDGSTLKRSKDNKSEAFLGAGYYILKDDTYQIVFHCGKNISGYGQADMLSVDITCNGENIISDCGTYLYNGPKEWRDYFKGTESHNTICVDKQDQMINHRRFKWLKPTDAKVSKWIDNDEFCFVEGSHYGYKRLKDAVVHSRAVFFNKGKYIVVADRLQGKEKHNISVTYNFAVKDYEILGGGSLSVKGEKCNITMVNCYYDNFVLKAQYGEEDPIGGWLSREYGSKIPCLRALYASDKMILPYCFGNVIYNSDNSVGYKVEGLHDQIKINGKSCENCFKVKIIGKQYTDYFVHVFNTPASCSIDIQDIGCFEGSTIIVTVDKQNIIVSKIAI